MPKYELYHKAGMQVKDDLKDLVMKYFSESEIVKLQKYGGRLLLSLSAPYVNRKSKRIDIVIDKDYVIELEKRQKKGGNVSEELDKLTVKQLHKITKIIRRPLPTNANSFHLKRKIIDYFGEEKLWKGISGS